MITLEERIENIKERIFQSAMEEFDDDHSEEEIEALLDNNAYYDAVYDQEIGIEGYEFIKYSDLDKLDYNDVMKIHNVFYGEINIMEALKECF